MADFVLDTSALLAMLNDEPGGERVAAAFRGGGTLHLSSVNLAELASKLADYGKPAGEALSLVRGLGVRIHPVDDRAAIEIGRLRPRTKPYGLSLGDRACLVLGAVLSLPVLTAERNWTNLDLSGYQLTRGGYFPPIERVRD